MRLSSTLIAVSLLAAPLAAQSPSTLPTVLDQLLAAIQIPTRAAELRTSGMPDSTVLSLIGLLQRNQLPATDVRDILTAERDGIRSNGATENFGAFVQTKLDQGLRGQELAAAIHDEHAQGGKWRVKSRDGGGSDDDGQDRADTAHGRAYDNQATPATHARGRGRGKN